MANFKEAYDITAKYEGGYVNDPADAGGETIFGVARNAWPNLGMWNKLDEYKRQGLRGKALEEACHNNYDFMREVETVYRTQYWFKVWGDRITDQKSANAIYDFAVNTGVQRAVKYAQIAAKATVDGKIGPKTVEAINNCSDFTNKYADLRCKFYTDLANNRPSNKKFLKGWLARANGLR